MFDFPIRYAGNPAPERYAPLQVVRIILVVVRLGLEAGVVVRARIGRDNHLDQPRYAVANPSGEENADHRKHPAPPRERVADGDGQEDCRGQHGQFDLLGAVDSFMAARSLVQMSVFRLAGECECKPCYPTESLERDQFVVNLDRQFHRVNSYPLVTTPSTASTRLFKSDAPKQLHRMPYTPLYLISEYSLRLYWMLR